MQKSKKGILLSAVLSLILLGFLPQTKSVDAAVGQPLRPSLRSKNETKSSCDTVLRACQAAGYLRGDKVVDGKHAFADCVLKLLQHQPVPKMQVGKNVLPKDIETCAQYRVDREIQFKARKAARARARAAKP